MNLTLWDGFIRFNFDNEFHHPFFPLRTIWRLRSEYSNGRPDGYSTGKDGVSIINLSTGPEVAYYDMLYVMDYSRSPQVLSEARQVRMYHG